MLKQAMAGTKLRSVRRLSWCIAWQPIGPPFMGELRGGGFKGGGYKGALGNLREA